jgi:hypothetical protein
MSCCVRANTKANFPLLHHESKERDAACALLWIILSQGKLEILGQPSFPIIIISQLPKPATRARAGGVQPVL